MDTLQLLRDMGETNEWLGVTEKADEKFKLTDKGRVK